jgi:hypothetical protein
VSGITTHWDRFELDESDSTAVICESCGQWTINPITIASRFLDGTESVSYCPACAYETSCPHCSRARVVHRVDLEIVVGGTWSRVGYEVFRSWTGGRRMNGLEYLGPIYVLGTKRLHDAE